VQNQSAVVIRLRMYFPLICVCNASIVSVLVNCDFLCKTSQNQSPFIRLGMYFPLICVCNISIVSILVNCDFLCKAIQEKYAFPLTKDKKISIHYGCFFEEVFKAASPGWLQSVCSVCDGPFVVPHV
jgi:hypothetical protein